ncbi:MAG: aldo/keto reductase, partial [Bacilli bacterium]|nr:aldo/keto reductase [Bacilli bacterium]
FEECIKVMNKEMEEKSLPELKDYLTDIKDYDLIYVGSHLNIGYPNYLDRAIVSQLLKLDFKGKVVMPFGAANASFKMDISQELQEAMPGATIKKFLWLNTRYPFQRDIGEWINRQKMNTITLSNGVEMPPFGLGTFLLEPKFAYESVKYALENGYFLIDTANMYGNEVSVGRAIKDNGIHREDVFISTKLWPTEYRKPFAVKRTLKRLGVDYIDLLFIHWPTKHWRSGYKKLIKAYHKGQIRSIGISNFEGRYLDELLNEFDVKPHVVQSKCNPLYPQNELREKAAKENIKIMTWFPLGGKGKTKDLLENETINKLAKKYQKTPSQIVLKWHVEKGLIPIPGSRNKEHILENILIFDFKMDEKDIAAIDKLGEGVAFIEADDAKLAKMSKFKPKYEKLK